MGHLFKCVETGGNRSKERKVLEVGRDNFISVGSRKEM